jgi:hypothetical protein
LVFRRSLSVALGVSGVRRTQGAMRWRAVWMSDKEIDSDMKFQFILGER